MKQQICIAAALAGLLLTACGTGESLVPAQTSGTEISAGISETAAVTDLTAETSLSADTAVSAAGGTSAGFSETSAVTSMETTAVSSDASSSTVLSSSSATAAASVSANMNDLKNAAPAESLAGEWKRMQDGADITLTVKKDGSYTLDDQGGTHKGTAYLMERVSPDPYSTAVRSVYRFLDTDGTVSTFCTVTYSVESGSEFYLETENGDIRYARTEIRDLVRAITGEWIELITSTGSRNVLTVNIDGTYQVSGKRGAESGTYKVEGKEKDFQTGELIYFTVFNLNGAYNGNLPYKMNEYPYYLYLGQAGDRQFVRKKDADLLTELAGEWKEDGGSGWELSISADGSFSAVCGETVVKGIVMVSMEPTPDGGVREQLVLSYHMGEQDMRWTFDVPEETRFDDLNGVQCSIGHLVRTGTPFRKYSGS
ncbi:MAG: hypothetical protein IK130_06995 [Oscillospiraceae bacterium]|nr:hypothetical protein [Oscillospiraceae bacterium]